MGLLCIYDLFWVHNSTDFTFHPGLGKNETPMVGLSTDLADYYLKNPSSAYSRSVHQLFFVSFFYKKSLEGKLMAHRQKNMFLFGSSQQLPCLLSYP